MAIAERGETDVPTDRFDIRGSRRPCNLERRPGCKRRLAKVSHSGTASPGGIYYVYGERLAEILTEKLGIPVNPLPTQGTVHNMKLLDSGGAQLGMTTTGVALGGWRGTGDWTDGKKFRNIRALFPMYDTPFQAIVLPRSGITTLAQFDKKRVAVGPRAGTGGTYIPAILKLLGISAETSYGSFAAMTDELFAGRLDAFITLTGAPMPAAQEAEAKEPVTFIRRLPNKLTPSERRCRSSVPRRSRREPTDPWIGTMSRRSV